MAKKSGSRRGGKKGGRKGGRKKGSKWATRGDPKGKVPTKVLLYRLSWAKRALKGRKNIVAAGGDPDDVHCTG